MTDADDESGVGAHDGITPQQCDIDIVEKQYGRLLPDASPRERAKPYRLYRAQALIRTFRSGSPDDPMRLWAMSDGGQLGSYSVGSTESRNQPLARAPSDCDRRNVG